MHILSTYYAHPKQLSTYKMSKEITNLKNDLKISFSKVKEHITSIENEILSIKTQLKELTEAINSQKHTNMKEIPIPIPPKEESSTGNKGVYSFIHSFNHSVIQSTNMQELLSKTTKQELLVLLTISQLNEELSNITYEDISNKLKLSQGCIRGYITSLIRKGAPIYKERYNNKITLIKTTQQFKEMGKQTLINAFYKVDPHQRRLLE